MFQIDQGGAASCLRTATLMSDGVRDALRSDHSKSELHYALASALTEKIDAYKDPKWLVKFWFSQTGPLAEIADSDPVLFMNLVNHLSAKLDELT